MRLKCNFHSNLIRRRRRSSDWYGKWKLQPRVTSALCQHSLSNLRGSVAHLLTTGVGVDGEFHEILATNYIIYHDTWALAITGKWNQILESEMSCRRECSSDRPLRHYQPSLSSSATSNWIIESFKCDYFNLVSRSVSLLMQQHLSFSLSLTRSFELLHLVDLDLVENRT